MGSQNLPYKSDIQCHAGNQQMGNCFTDENRHGSFSHNKAALRQTDRKNKVRDKQLITFPFDNIGLIQSQLCIDKKSSQEFKGTGFLISQSLVLTSAHNFAVWDEASKSVKQLKPLSFSILQCTENGQVIKNHAINDIKLNCKFIGLFNEIMIQKNNMEQSKEKIFRQCYEQKILDLDKLFIQHDFALLKLDEPIIRPRQFELCPSQTQKCMQIGGVDSGSAIQADSDGLIQIINGGGIDIIIKAKCERSGWPVYLTEDSSKVVGIYNTSDSHKRLNLTTMITQSVMIALKQWASQMGSLRKRMDQNPIRIESINDLIRKGDKCRDYGKFEEALSNYKRALDITQMTKGNKSVEYAINLDIIGGMHLWERRYQKSLDYFIEELKIYEIIPQKQSLQKANALTKISIALRKLCRDQGANDFYKKAVNIYKQIEILQIKCPYTLHNIGQMFALQGRTAKALQYYNKAITVDIQIGNVSIQWARTLRNIGIIYKDQGKLQIALEYYKKAVHIHKKIGKKSIQMVNILKSIGQIYENKKQFAQALRYNNEAYSIDVQQERNHLNELIISNASIMCPEKPAQSKQ